jgi:hypothetical protein
MGIKLLLLRILKRKPLLERFVYRAFNAKSHIRKALRGTRQIDFDSANSGARLLLIAPAEKRIPVDGWGAVELVIQNQLLFFREQGFSTNLLNSYNLIDWWRVFRRKPQVVICHYDVFTPRARIFSKLFHSKLIAITHYAYAQQPNKWDQDFQRLARHLSQVDTLVALNPKISAVFEALNPSLRCVVIPNGVSVSSFKVQRNGAGVICLGKVEPRKAQVMIARHLTGAEDIVFVGDICDPEFSTLDDSQKAMFVGPWDRTQVENKLGGYSTLILLSDGEADALVLYEAQSAGLRIVVNNLSIGSQDPNLPWLILTDSNLRDIRSIPTLFDHLDPATREEIISHAKTHYTANLSNAKYKQIVLDLLAIG